MNVVVIVPAYNAARHVKAVLERIAATAVPGLARIVVVNDGSTDDTGTRIAELAALHGLIDQIDRVNNGGYGGAMKDPLGRARASCADPAAHVQADRQYGPQPPPALS